MNYYDYFLKDILFINIGVNRIPACLVEDTSYFVIGVVWEKRIGETLSTLSLTY